MQTPEHPHALPSHWCPPTRHKRLGAFQGSLVRSSRTFSAGCLVQVVTESRTEATQTLGSSCSINKTGRYCSRQPRWTATATSREAGDGDTLLAPHPGSEPTLLTAFGPGTGYSCHRLGGPGASLGGCGEFTGSALARPGWRGGQTTLGRTCEGSLACTPDQLGTTGEWGYARLRAEKPIT